MRSAVFIFSVLVVFLSVLPRAAHAQDCTPTTFIPQCVEGSSTQLGYCDLADEIVKVANCDQFTDSCGPIECVGALCGIVAFDGCLGAQGRLCSLQTASAVNYPPLFCEESACLRRSGGVGAERCSTEFDASCVVGVDGLGCIGQVASQCLGESAAGIAFVQPVLTDCASFSSQCAEGENGASICMGGSGAVCDDLTLRPGSHLTCQPGLSCVDATIIATGTCQAAGDAGPTTDSGFVLIDSGPAVDGGPAVDAGPSSLDAGDIGEVDAGFTQLDGGFGQADGGQVALDGGFAMLPDGGLIFADGGFLTLPDGGQVALDGGFVRLDGGFVQLDGGFVQLDGGLVAVDGGSPPVDAGSVDGGGDTDAGVTPTPTDGGPFGTNACGDEVSALGTCDGQTLRFCQAGVVTEIDCAGIDRVCAEIGPTTGSDCVRPEDAPTTGDPAASLFCLCASPGSGPPAAALLLGLLALTLRRRRR